MTTEKQSSTPPSGDEKLSRVLGAGDSASIMISNMIGTGILIFPGLVALSLGNLYLAILAWALGGLVSLAGALVHAELGSRYPRAGGDYVFLREAFGVPAAFLSGWTSFVVGFPGAIALSAMGASNALFDAAALPKTRWGLLELALALLVGISLIHSFGLELGKRVQNFLVLLKVAILLVLIAAAFLLVEPVPAQEFPEQGIHFATAAFLLLFAYSGWNSAAYVAGEIREPRKNLPRALIGGVLVVTVLYIAANLAYFRVVPVEEMWNANVMGVVAGKIFGGGGGQVFSIALSLVFIGSASAMIITGPRIYYAMAGDGVFPRSLTSVGKWSRVPTRALWLQSFWAGGILILGTILTPDISEENPITKTFNTIADWTIFAILPFAALTTCSIFVLRRRIRAESNAPAYSTPGYPLTPFIFVGAVLAAEVAFLIVGTDQDISGDYAARNQRNALIGTLLVVSGIPAYFFWKLWGGGRSAPTR